MLVQPHMGPLEVGNFTHSLKGSRRARKAIACRLNIASVERANVRMYDLLLVALPEELYHS